MYLASSAPRTPFSTRWSPPLSMRSVFQLNRMSWPPRPTTESASLPIVAAYPAARLPSQTAPHTEKAPPLRDMSLPVAFTLPVRPSRPPSSGTTSMAASCARAALPCTPRR